MMHLLFQLLQNNLLKVYDISTLLMSLESDKKKWQLSINNRYIHVSCK